MESTKRDYTNMSNLWRKCDLVYMDATNHLFRYQYHRRLFVINTKQAYIDKQNLHKLGSQQKRRFDDATAKLEEAEAALDRLQIPFDEIKEAWAEQLSTQQAEPPRAFFVVI